MTTNRLLGYVLLVCIIVYIYVYYRHLLLTRLPPRMIKFLQKYGDYNIIEMQLCRTEISDRVRTIFFGLSYGKLRQTYSKKGPIMHPYILLTIRKGDDTQTVLFEKNEVVVLRIPSDTYLKRLKDPEYTQCMGLLKGIQGLTLNEFITKNKTKLKERFVRYHCTKDNCQIFLHNILIGENMIPTNKQEEIKQFLSPEKTEEVLSSFGVTVYIVNILQEILGVKEFIQYS